MSFGWRENWKRNLGILLGLLVVVVVARGPVLEWLAESRRQEAARQAEREAESAAQRALAEGDPAPMLARLEQRLKVLEAQVDRDFRGGANMSAIQEYTDAQVAIQKEISEVKSRIADIRGEHRKAVDEELSRSDREARAAAEKDPELARLLPRLRENSPTRLHARTWKFETEEQIEGETFVGEARIGMPPRTKPYSLSRKIVHTLRVTEVGDVSALEAQSDQQAFPGGVSGSPGSVTPSAYASYLLLAQALPFDSRYALVRQGTEGQGDQEMTILRQEGLQAEVALLQPDQASPLRQRRHTRRIHVDAQALIRQVEIDVPVETEVREDRASLQILLVPKDARVYVDVYELDDYRLVEGVQVPHRGKSYRRVDGAPGHAVPAISWELKSLTSSPRPESG